MTLEVIGLQHPWTVRTAGTLAMTVRWPAITTKATFTKTTGKNSYTRLQLQPVLTTEVAAMVLGLTMTFAVTRLGLTCPSRLPNGRCPMLELKVGVDVGTLVDTAVPPLSTTKFLPHLQKRGRRIDETTR